jgi:hypothetical protein
VESDNTTKRLKGNEMKNGKREENPKRNMEEHMEGCSEGSMRENLEDDKSDSSNDTKSPAESVDIGTRKPPASATLSSNSSNSSSRSSSVSSLKSSQRHIAQQSEASEGIKLRNAKKNRVKILKKLIADGTLPEECLTWDLDEYEGTASDPSWIYLRVPSHTPNYRIILSENPTDFLNSSTKPPSGSPTIVKPVKSEQQATPVSDGLVIDALVLETENADALGWPRNGLIIMM